jgi:mono/diheme cytochrome c family protein
MKRISLVVFLFAAVLFFIHQVITLLDNHLPFGRMWETPVIRPHEEKPLRMASGTVPFKGGEALFRAADPQDLRSPFPKGDPVVVEEGRVLYFRYCDMCHGRNHDGIGTVGQSFAPLPADLRSPEVRSLPEGVRFKVISYGIEGGRQPPLDATISVPDRWKIIAYVDSLGPRR